MAFSWKCPFCGRHATIISENFKQQSFEFNNGNKYEQQSLIYTVIVCPNPECREYTLRVVLCDHRFSVSAEKWENLPPKQNWQLIPAADIKVFPDYVPETILADYRESCVIKDLSPKASATLSRRCLQGMIRDFWNVKKARLIDEIDAIEGKVDPITWKAIDSVRKIGNIGAHMEKDINLIVDVDPEEAALLISLIETLIHDWYVTRHERDERMRKIVSISDAKKAAKTNS